MTTKAMGTLGTIDSLTIGGRVFTDLSTNLIHLVAIASNSCTFRKADTAGSSGYQVTGGKSLYIKAIRVCVITQSGGQINLCQSDNDVGYNGSTSPTNPIWLTGGGSSQNSSLVTSAAGQILELELNFPIAASKYFTMQVSGTALAVVYAYGYES